MQTSQDNIIHVNCENFEEMVLGHDGAVLLDFWAEWCEPCKMLCRELDSVAKHFGSKLRVAMLNVDENEHLATLFQITEIPALKLIDKGRIVGGWLGFLPDKYLVKEIEKALANNEGKGHARDKG